MKKSELRALIKEQLIKLKENQEVEFLIQFCTQNRIRIQKLLIQQWN